MEKENNSDESSFSENEISDLIFLSLLNLNQKHIGDIISGSIDGEEEGAE